MGFWQRRLGRQSAEGRQSRTSHGISHAVLEQASSDDLCRAAHESLRADLAGAVDRFGVWLAPEGENTGEPQTFKGHLWDADTRSSTEEDLLEWNVLGNLGALPEDLLRKLALVEEVSSSSDLPLAVAAGMRRHLWVPVILDEQLAGVLFAATRRKHGLLPRNAMVRAAADLAVGLGFRKRSVAHRNALGEQALQGKLLAELGDYPLDQVLEDIAKSSWSCGTDRQPIGPFVMIGLPRGRMAQACLDAPLEFHWTAGDRLWARAAMSDPLAPVWREALLMRKTVGREIRAPWSNQQVVRLIAIPLLVTGEPAGILVAGLESSAATLATLERLEARARLAELALALSKATAPHELFFDSARFFIDHAAEPWFLLNAKLEITRASEAGKKLLSLGSVRPRHQDKSQDQRGEAASKAQSLGTAAQLFRPAEWQRMVSWMREVSRNSPSASSPFAEAELRSGGRVRWHAARLAGGGLGLLAEPSGGERRNAGSRAGAEMNSLTEWLDHGIVIFDEHHRVRSINPRFAQFFGLSAAELGSARSLGELVALAAPRVEEPDQFAKRWRDAVRAGDSTLLDEIQVKQPAARVLERVTRPVLDFAGSRIGHIEIYRDVTSHQLLQSKLRKDEHLVAIGEKVSAIAHELSNPLTTILGYAQRLLARTDGAARGEELQRIFSEAERASSILRQLLDSTRESAADLRPLNLNALVQRTVDMHRFQLASDKIRVELDLAASLPRMQGDSGQLQQVLVNLIANSRHALLEMRRPGAISFRTWRSDQGRIMLEVSDSGPGIPEALRHRIFDPFFTTKPAGIGTGLGLSIVAGLVRQHGGQIHLNSAPGKGARFLIDFPAVAAEVPLLLSELPPALSVAPALSPGELVLVVEDEPTVGQLIADMLSDLGHKCEVHHDARRALISALNRDYSLVICDIKMPGLDGPHFYRALAEAGSPLISRFLFVTGDVLGAGTRDFLKQNGLSHIAKPFRLEEFNEKVAMALAEPAAVSGVPSGRDGARQPRNLVGHG